MNSLILFQGVPSDATLPPSLDPQAVRAVWDKGHVAAGEVSIPQELERRLSGIRAELAAWTYETGCCRVQGMMLEEHLRAGDSLSMWWCSTLVEKHPKVTHNLFEALKLRALEQVLEERQIKELTLLSPSNGLSWLPEVLGRFCHQTGRRFTHVTTAPVPAPEQSLRERLTACYHALPALVKAAVRLPVWWWRVRRLLPSTHQPSPVQQTLPEGQQNASIVTYFPNIDMKLAQQGRFRSRYWEGLHDLLHGEEGKPKPYALHWVFVYFPAPQCSLSEALALRDRFQASGQDGASFHFLEEFLTPAAIRRSLIRFGRLALSSWRIEPDVQSRFCFAGSHMDLWPVLRENWSDSVRGWRALERCLMREAFTGYAAWAGKQAWTLLPQENCPWERMLAQAVHEQHDGVVYGAQHSTVRATDFRYFDDPRMLDDPACRKAMLDMWLCNGTGARDALLATGLPEERFGLVEALRYGYLAPAETREPAEVSDVVEASRAELASESAAAGQEPEASLAQDLEQTGLIERAEPIELAGLIERAEQIERAVHPEQSGQGEQAAHTAPKRLLVVTSFFADETDAHLETFAAASKAGILDGWDVSLKAHPYLPVQERLQRLFGDSPKPCLLDAPIAELLTEGTVVWASNSTTVALEAAFKGLPVLVQAAENDVNLCPLQDVAGVVFTRSPEDVRVALRDPKAPELPKDYLALDPALPRWRAVLGLR